MQPIVPQLDPDEVRAPRPAGPDRKAPAGSLATALAGALARALDRPAPRREPAAPPRAAPAAEPGAEPAAARPASPAPEPQAERRAAPPPGPRHSPGPSKLAYRASRAWAKPVVRNAVLVYLPLAALGLIGWRIAADDGLRGLVAQKVEALVERVASRPEFAIRSVEVTGGSEAVEAEVLATLGVRPGMSSLSFDVEELRHRVEALGVIAGATVQIDPQGTLRVAVVQRVEAALYRRPDGVLVLLDPEGIEIGPAGQRADHPSLPVILGAGAQERVGEVLDLLAAANDILPRLRALIRVGERRWDVVLDRDLVIKLPADDPVDALARVMALHYGEELLDRGLAVIDMRLPTRPALRMTPDAAEAFQIRRAVAAIGGEDT